MLGRKKAFVCVMTSEEWTMPVTTPTESVLLGLFFPVTFPHSLAVELPGNPGWGKDAEGDPSQSPFSGFSLGQ